jgi:CheY-like chemotaxis protein
VLVVTTVDDERKALALGADAWALKPIDRDWLRERLDALTGAAARPRVLVVDDDEVSRYLLRGLLAATPYQVLEASSGAEGVERARGEHPDAIVLDLVMPGMSGVAVLDALDADPATRDIPVVVVTSNVLDAAERHALASRTVAVVSKAASREAALAAVTEALARAGVARGDG